MWACETSLILCLLLGNVMTEFWGWCLFALCKVCERWRCGQSRKKSSSKRSTVQLLKHRWKSWNCEFYCQRRCFGSFANMIEEIIVSSTNSWSCVELHNASVPVMPVWCQCTRRAGIAFWMRGFTVCSLSFPTDEVLSLMFSVWICDFLEKLPDRQIVILKSGDSFKIFSSWAFSDTRL